VAPPFSDNEYWTDADGKTWHYTELTSSHLRNLIFYLHRRYAAQITYEFYVKNPITKAQWVEKMTNGSPAEEFKIYPLLVQEADRRKLTRAQS